MSTEIRHRGRPRGAKRAALTGWMAGTPSFTMGQVSRSLGWPISDANKTINRALEAGEVRVCGSMRTPEAKRPVAVYQRADAPVNDVPLSSLMRVWS